MLTLARRDRGASTFLLPYALIILAAFTVYFSTLSYGLVAFDDDLLITGNRVFLERLPNIPAAFRTDAFFTPRDPVFYRPLQTVSFMLDLALRPDHPAIFHLSNLILHCLTCIALFHLLCRMHFDRRLSLLGALIYTVHPLFGMAVSWIPGRGDLLLGFFAVTALIFFARFVEARRVPDLAGHYLCLLLALFSKESAVAVPVIALGYFLLNQSESAPQRRLTAVFGVIAGWCGILAVWMAMRSAVIHVDAGHIGSALAALYANLAVIPELVGHFLLPFQITLIPRFTLIQTTLGLVLMAGGTLFFAMRKTVLLPQAALGLLWFIVCILPSMAYSHPLGASAYSYLNQRAYLPMMGVLILVLAAIPVAWSQGRIPFVTWPGAVLIVALGFLSASQALSFAEPVVFYAAAIESNPRSALAYNNRGRVLAGSGNIRQAMNDFNQALALLPAYADALSNRAFVRSAQKDNAGALSDLAQALRVNPKSAAAYGNLGIVRANLNDYSGALESFGKAIELDPGFVDAYANRALLRLKMSDFRGAIVDYDAALARNPKSPVAYFGRASAYFQINQLSAACRDWDTAAHLGNQDAAVNYQEACREGAQRQ